MARALPEILADLQSRTVRGSPAFYKPLMDPAERQLVHQLYHTQLAAWVSSSGRRDHKGLTLKNHSGTVVARGFTRVVVGDYGAYIEFSEAQAATKNLKPRWPGKPLRPVKYLWLETADEEKTKVYLQQAKVSYADYKPGMYYVAPGDLKVDFQ